MHMKYLAWLVPSLLIGAAGCPDVKVDPGEGVDGPLVEFDPAKAILPFPNNLALDPTTGKVNLPEQCNEGALSAATRTQVLNKLDGFGTFETAMQITFTEAVDETSLAGKVVLYKRAAGTVVNDPAAAVTIPVKLIKGTTVRYADQTNIKACTDPKMIDSLTIVPMIPLDQKSTYVAAVLKGVKTATGADYGASFTWSLIRQEADPVTLADPMCDPSTSACAVKSDRTPLDPSIPAQLAQLNGIDLLWKAHAKAMAFLAAKHAREDVLVAWEFNTQTVTDPLDPTVAGSLAAMVDETPLFGVSSVLGGATPTQFYEARVGATVCQTDGGPLPCQAIGDIIGGLLNANDYQVAQPAKITTLSSDPNEGGPIPGPFNDPVHPTKVGNTGIAVFGMIPATAPPATGYPVVIFGHGLGSSKTTLAAIGAQLAAAGFASVAIDFVAHDSRAVRTSTDATIGCADSGSPLKPPPPTSFPQCYAPFLSADLAGTRDNIRQSVLDLQELQSALKGCGLTNCGSLKVDVAKINYVGISLGGIMGSTAVASKGGFRAAVLNVPIVGWIDALENTQTNDIKCPLVDALIDAKFITGDKWNPTANPQTGLCTTDAWKAQPGYQQFSVIGRWAIDPADGANFTAKLATRKFLIQEVIGDLVLPNIATNNEGALVGLMAGATADVGVPNAAPPPFMLPTASLTAAPTANHFLKYPTLPPAAPSFPGNTFAHASLLRPANAGNDGALGTARLQTDAIYFLSANNQ